MQNALRLAIAECALLALVICLGPGPILAARKPDLGALNQKLAGDIVKAKLRSVIVVDFQDAQDKPCTLGWYVADELSENWLAEKQKFRVLGRSELKDTKVEPTDLGAEMLKRLGSVWGVDAIVTGAVETSPENYIVSATVRRAADNTTIASESIAVPHSHILDLLKPLPDPSSLSRAGVNGVSVPMCITCPVPGYSDRARAVKAQGTIVLDVLVSADGRAEIIAIRKGLGFGLTQVAIEAVSEWHFKPATTKEGEPVPVIVPVEVTLRIN
jgi:TonB family protein